MSSTHVPPPFGVLARVQIRDAGAVKVHADAVGVADVAVPLPGWTVRYESSVEPQC